MFLKHDVLGTFTTLPEAPWSQHNMASQCCFTHVVFAFDLLKLPFQP